MLRNIQTNFFCFFIYTKPRKQSYNAKADQCTDKAIKVTEVINDYTLLVEELTPTII